MRWLFIIGTALDLSGAAVIAWPIFYARRGELREEGTMRLGRNAWVIVARTREQRFVRLGMILLGLGFVCQLVGYVARLHGATEIGVAVVLVASIIGAALAVVIWLANVRLPRYREVDQTASTLRIEDITDIYGVRDLNDVPLFWRIALGRDPVASDAVVESYVSHGRWVADCVCGGGIVTSPDLDHATCLDCGTLYQVRFPDNREEIESVLLGRPDKRNRNWRPGETMESLQAENAQHGAPLFIGGDISSSRPSPAVWS